MSAWPAGFVTMKFNQRGMLSFKRRTPKASGETVTLVRRLSTGDVVLTIEGASQSPNSVEIIGGDGFPVTVILTDWWLPVDQVIFDSKNAGGIGDNKPRMGDELTTAGGLVFEPMRPGPGAEPVNTVAMGYYWLVHTKQTEAAVPVT